MAVEQQAGSDDVESKLGSPPLAHRGLSRVRSRLVLEPQRLEAQEPAGLELCLGFGEGKRHALIDAERLAETLAPRDRLPRLIQRLPRHREALQPDQCPAVVETLHHLTKLLPPSPIRCVAGKTTIEMHRTPPAQRPPRSSNSLVVMPAASSGTRNADPSRALPEGQLRAHTTAKPAWWRNSSRSLSPSKRRCHVTAAAQPHGFAASDPPPGSVKGIAGMIRPSIMPLR